MSKMGHRFSPEVRDRAVRMVGEHRADYGSEWEAMSSDCLEDWLHGRDAAPLVSHGGEPTGGASGAGR
jgi:hypothetical protein